MSLQISISSKFGLDLPSGTSVYSCRSRWREVPEVGVSEPPAGLLMLFGSALSPVSRDLLQPFLPMLFPLTKFWLRKGAESAIAGDGLLSEACQGCISLTHFDPVFSHGWVGQKCIRASFYILASVGGKSQAPPAGGRTIILLLLPLSSSDNVLTSL